MPAREEVWEAQDKAYYSDLDEPWSPQLRDRRRSERLKEQNRAHENAQLIQKHARRTPDRVIEEQARQAEIRKSQRQDREMRDNPFLFEMSLSPEQATSRPEPQKRALLSKAKPTIGSSSASQRRSSPSARSTTTPFFDTDKEAEDQASLTLPPHPTDAMPVIVTGAGISPERRGLRPPNALDGGPNTPTGKKRLSEYINNPSPSSQSKRQRQ